MNREMGLFEALASDGAYNVCVIVRGELAIGRIFAPHTSHEGGTVKGTNGSAVPGAVMRVGHRWQELQTST
jgi:hypothetical protein